MNSVLVTGGCGYIGSHTVLNLLDKGFNVYIIDSHQNSSYLVVDRLFQLIRKNGSKNVNNLHYFKGDLRIIDDLKYVFSHACEKGKSINAVIHFAGLKAVEESARKPLLYWDSNVLGTINLLKVMKEFLCKTLIFSSSATIYSNSDNVEIKEHFQVNPINPYGRTKATVEAILNDVFDSDRNWKIVNLRYFNPIGAHSSGKLGENPFGRPTNIFPLILKVASKEIDELKIFGKDWNTKDGTCIRDYIHIMDLAEGHLAALIYLQNNSSQIINFNVGTGEGYTILELIDTFEEVNNVKVPYSFIERREGDQEKVVADNSKILSILDWRPKRSLKNMCRDGWKWQLLNPNGYV
tara:strand:- start:884 stop:1936 length:1053 start_codon:yes stop_codon:yes gene_type:complete